MSYGPTDPAWEEYMTTGIDPTGGELGPDFDPVTGRRLDEFVEDDERVVWQEDEEPDYSETLPDWAKRPDYIPDRILFFDTETDGLPIEYPDNGSIAPEDWPHIVQLAWLMTDDVGSVLSSGSRIIQPLGFTIPEDAVAVHGITTEYALEHGEPRKKVMTKFRNVLNKANLIVAHNIVFDANVVAAEMARSGLACDIMYKNAFCTMVGTTDLCKLPFPNDVSPYGNYKWPKLTELHQFLFGKDFSGAHDALADVRATARCFWELIHRNLI